MLRRCLRPFLLSLGLVSLLSLAALFLSRPDSLPLPAKPAGALRIGTANLHFGNTRPAEVSAQLLSARPDILLLVEWTGANADLEALRREGYRLVLDHPRIGPHGLALLVRDGVEAWARLHDAPVPSPCRLPLAVARMRMEGCSFTFLGVHAPPPVPSCQGTNRPYLEALASRLADGRLRDDFGFGHRGDPVLLAGDLNAMPWGPALAALRRSGLDDLPRHFGGRRLKPTWSPLPAIPSLIRLDYILAGAVFKPLSAWTLDLPDTDHRAVIADLALPPSKP